jgi:hypothetical protein
VGGDDPFVGIEEGIDVLLVVMDALGNAAVVTVAVGAALLVDGEYVGAEVIKVADVDGDSVVSFFGAGFSSTVPPF